MNRKKNYPELEDKLIKILNKYYPINFDEENIELNNELYSLMFDLTIDITQDDLSEIEERILNDLWNLNSDRKSEYMLKEKLRNSSIGRDITFPKKY